MGYRIERVFKRVSPKKTGNKTVKKTVFSPAVLIALFISITSVTFVDATKALAQSKKINNISSRIVKAQILARLRVAQEKQVKDLGQIDAAVKARMQEVSTISLRSSSATEAQKNLTRLTDELSNLNSRRDETLARRDFLGLLIFTFDTKWNAQPIETFLEHRLLDLAMNDMALGSQQGRLWKFMTYLSIAIREMPDQREDLLGLIENYMEFSSILNPKSPTEFINSRDYSNGSSSVSAQTVDRESLGDHLEKKLEEFRKLQTENKLRVKAETIQ